MRFEIESFFRVLFTMKSLTILSNDGLHIDPESILVIQDPHDEEWSLEIEKFILATKTDPRNVANMDTYTREFLSQF